MSGALGAIGQTAQALAAARKSVELKSDYPQGWRNFADALFSAGDLDGAQSALGRAISLRPDWPEGHNALGLVLRRREKLDESEKQFRRAIDLRPDYADAHCNLAAIAMDQGRITSAIELRRKAISLHPTNKDVLSNLLFAMHYDPDASPEQIAQEHRRWGQLHGDRYASDIQPHSNDRTANRRLRIGYLSADFRRHPVANFLEPILAAHDHQQFEIFCYSNVAQEDDLTPKFKSLADQWRDIANLTDANTAQLIRDDRIDILVDLIGHMDRNRLLVFARKPAPVQITYLGYPDTTGLRQIDYRITDSHHDPAGVSDHLHTEKLIRLDPSAWCFRARTDLPVSPLPAPRAGHVTFASLNNPMKLNERVIALWSRILANVPRSRLMLLIQGESSGAQELLRMFATHNITPDRMHLIGRCSHEQYMKLFDEIDIALDPFPYNGHTTTCNALWMGVPVVALAGKIHVSRAGVSVLTNIGLPELIAKIETDYARIATELAHDLDRLRQIRENLRPQFTASRLAKERDFATRLQRVYRDVWQQWCATH